MSGLSEEARRELEKHCAEHRGLHCGCCLCESCGECVLCDAPCCDEPHAWIGCDCDGPEIAAEDARDMGEVWP